ncbi:hypothetical protein [Stygiolobus caldivivus]|uniref:Uncharacterized protein n=1 Tax=Stygiolobus caldivivus TaxID=2824673 RepID=A0A8D5U7C5_9CREN|nr:hypothetical protein [Stygiolobus caldivivus]BCU71065.1 hypothetical protein KN1_23620 [Stygiolobus caldivivus]
MVENILIILGLALFTWLNGIITYKTSVKLGRSANYLLGEGKRKIIIKFLEKGVEFFSESSLSELLEEILIANKIEGEVKFDNLQKQVIDKARAMNDEIGKIYNLSKLMIRIDNIANKFSVFSRQLKIISLILFLLPLVNFAVNSYFGLGNSIVDILECTVGTNLLAMSYLIIINSVYLKRQLKRNCDELEI